MSERHAEIVRPQDNGQDSLPKSQVEKPNREEPGGNPNHARKTVLMDLDLFHGPEFTPGKRRRRQDSSGVSTTPAGLQAGIPGRRAGGPRGDLSEAELLERLSYLHPNRILEMQRRNL